MHQQRLIRTRNREQCFQAFLHNHWVGLVVFLGVLADRSLLTLWLSV
jgi:4-hydroxybenzoate polyprenyltransferase